MKRVFADTFYFLALFNPKDQAHSRAVAAAMAIKGELVTTSWILTEVADAMSAPHNRAEFMLTLEDLRQSPQVRIYAPDPVLFDAGIQLFASRFLPPHISSRCGEVSVVLAAILGSEGGVVTEVA